MKPSTQILEVWGELACFTRPEMKVERFSYPVITPSAARGIFDAIYWKNKFYWQVTKIEVLKPPRYIALRRNEVKEKLSTASVAKWMQGKEDPKPILADGDKGLLGTDEKGRTQRQTMALKNVKYRLHAHIVPRPGHEHEIVSLEAQFKRHARNGQCIYQPYFGCREFPAYFRLLVDAEEQAQPDENINIDIGLMLYDVFDLSCPGTWENKPVISLFRARVQQGVMIVPPYESDEVLKPRKGVK